MRPYFVQTHWDYVLWVEELIEDAGGYYLDEVTLLANYVEPEPEVVIGLEFPNQRIGFLEGTFLKIEAIFDEELDPVRYSYHFQHEGVDADLIFRKPHRADRAGWRLARLEVVAWAGRMRCSPHALGPQPSGALAIVWLPGDVISLS